MKSIELNKPNLLRLTQELFNSLSVEEKREFVTVNRTIIKSLLVDHKTIAPQSKGMQFSN